MGDERQKANGMAKLAQVREMRIHKARARNAALSQKLSDHAAAIGGEVSYAELAKVAGAKRGSATLRQAINTSMKDGGLVRLRPGVYASPLVDRPNYKTPEEVAEWAHYFTVGGPKPQC